MSLIGPLELPSAPRRVVVLDAAMAAGTLLDAGIEVIGMISERPPTLTAAEAAEIADVGSIVEPNMKRSPRAS